MTAIRSQRAFATPSVAKPPLRKKLNDPWFLLILFAIVQLNFQKVLYELLGLSEVDAIQHPLLLMWVAALLIVMAKAMAGPFYRKEIRKGETLILWLFALSFLHGCYAANILGITGGIFAFLTWAVGIGVCLYIAHDANRIWSVTVLKILVFGGVVNALPVLWESFTGIAIFKSVTLYNQTRLYGISQSVSVLGVQLALGIIASLYFLVSRHAARKTLLALIACQLIALLISTSRGPLIYMLISISLIAILLPSSSAKKALTFFIAGAAGLALLLIAILSSLSVQAGSQLDFIFNALTTGDAGNAQRLRYYSEAFDIIFADLGSFLIGQGAGLLSVAQVRAGGSELGSESSVLKAFLELGVLGGVPILIIALGSIFRGLRLWLFERRLEALFLSGCLLVLLLQATTHETLKAWIGLVYLWLLIGAILNMYFSRFPARRGRPNLNM